ncbi:MAG: hypothetical protein ACREL6_02535 [Gemmatimonadales bacterium]
MAGRAAWLISVLALWPIAASAQDPMLARIRHVPDRTLGDAAIAVADENDPVVYYNPILLSRFGPEIAAFVMAHEYGHIHYGHMRPRDDGPRGAEADAMMQHYELEADCYAARLLGEDRRGAILAAIAFFDEIGDHQVDPSHPSGTARAQQLRTCLPQQPQTASSGKSPLELVDPVTANGSTIGTGAGVVRRDEK